MDWPDYKKLIFQQNHKRSDIFDLKGSTFTKFRFIRLSRPRQKFLIDQGAKYCIESWNNGKKSLFTGLLPFNGNIYYGDHKTPTRCKKSFLIAIIEPLRITLFYFNSFSLYPKLKKGFIKRFLKEKPRDFPGLSCPN